MVPSYAYARPPRKLLRTLLLIAFLTFFLWQLRSYFALSLDPTLIVAPLQPEKFPVSKLINLPRQRAAEIPKIQNAPAPETRAERKLREARLQEVKETFLHAWTGYRKGAWGKDELRPVDGGHKSPFCGWAATLVDSLDTLLIMGLHSEFEDALLELEKVDFVTTEGCQINLFEMTIRHLGGLLSAYDLSGGRRVLIEKALELAEVLFTAFDTENRMPTPHFEWSWNDTRVNDHKPSNNIVVAVLGSLSLEFTRLSQITGNEKYFDGIQRVINELEKWQTKTRLPGMWPTIVDSSLVHQPIALRSPFPDGEETFTLGALADSTYEYLPKEYMLLGGRSASYRNMYEKFVTVAKKHLFFRPMTVGDHDILLSGSLVVSPNSPPRLNPAFEHLTCFTGGMLAIAGRIFSRPEDIVDGKKLTDGCIWAYQNTITGIMPETLTAVPCEDEEVCPWDTEKWFKGVDWSTGGQGKLEEDVVRDRIRYHKLPPGFAMVSDARYLLRPEAIESVFIMWRITADPFYPTAGWEMFKSIQAHCTTALAHSAIDSVLTATPQKSDEMESFWLAETIKYFYLLYSEPSVISLDEYVLNTEAHPLKRPR